jgi:hypothetical protein
LKKLNPKSFGISRLRVSLPKLNQIFYLKIFPNFQNPIKLSNLSNLKNLNSIGDPFKDLGFIFPISDGTLLLKLVLHGKFPNSDKSKNSQNLNILKPPYSIKANPRFNP